ncbi:MAG: glycosyltransferase family 1 protein, partial [Muribaculaceae bacterium]|nr:glycosyltransferase family 1 protein [Muribaculaceae bacterium]
MIPDRPLDILLVGDASSYHPTLADALRSLGHHVTVASDGCISWMQTRREINTARRLPGKLGGLDLWMRLGLNRKRLFSGYDI